MAKRPVKSNASQSDLAIRWDCFAPLAMTGSAPGKFSGPRAHPRDLASYGAAKPRPQRLPGRSWRARRHGMMATCLSILARFDIGRGLG